jgi:hypothetical protein
MVSKAGKRDNETEPKKGRVKFGKLKLDKETVKDLSGSEKKQIKGGAKRQASAVSCAPTCPD